MGLAGLRGVFDETVNKPTGGSFGLLIEADALLARESTAFDSLLLLGVMAPEGGGGLRKGCPWMCSAARESASIASQFSLSSSKSAKTSSLCPVIISSSVK